MLLVITVTRNSTLQKNSIFIHTPYKMFLFKFTSNKNNDVFKIRENDIRKNKYEVV